MHKIVAHTLSESINKRLGVKSIFTGHCDYFSDTTLLDNLQQAYQNASTRKYGNIGEPPPTFFLNPSQTQKQDFNGEDMRQEIAWRIGDGHPQKSPHEGKTFYNIYKIIEIGILPWVAQIIGHEYNHAKDPGTFSSTIIQLQNLKKSITAHAGITLSIFGNQIGIIANDFNDFKVNYPIINADNALVAKDEMRTPGTGEIYKGIRREWSYEKQLEKKDTGQVQKRSPYWAIILRTYEKLCKLPDNYILQDTYDQNPSATKTITTIAGEKKISAHHLDEDLNSRAQKLTELFSGSLIGEQALDQFVEIMEPYLPAKNENVPSFDYGKNNLPDKDDPEYENTLETILSDVSGELIGKARRAGGEDKDYQQAQADYNNIVADIIATPKLKTQNQSLEPLYRKLIQLDLFDIKKFPQLQAKGRAIMVTTVPPSRFVETDHAYSLLTYGLEIPGITTLKFSPLKGKARAEGTGYPNLMVWVDMSNSSESPFGKLSATRVGPGRAIFSWFKLNPKVMARLVMFDDTIIDTGWNRDEEKIVATLLQHKSGFTHLHPRILNATSENAEEMPYFNVWYTDLSGFQEVTSEKILALHKYFNRSSGTLIFLTPQKDGTIAYKEDTIKIFTNAGVPSENIYKLRTLKDLEKISIKIISNAVTKGKVEITGKHAEAVIKVGVARNMNQNVLLEGKLKRIGVTP